MELTDKQEKFISEYLVDLNATQAAIRAKYSKHTAQQMGAENLSKPVIQQAIEKAQSESAKRNQITVDRITSGHLEAFEMAKKNKQASAMTTTMKNLSELHGFLVHKTEDLSQQPVELNLNFPEGKKPCGC